MKKTVRNLVIGSILLLFSASMVQAHEAAKEQVDFYKLSVTQYLLDSAGLHGIAEKLASSKKIDESALTVVTRLKKVLVQTTWPNAVQKKATELIQSLDQLAVALKAGKVDDAIKLSDTVHEEQHDLSKTIDTLYPTK